MDLENFATARHIGVQVLSTNSSTVSLWITTMAVERIVAECASLFGYSYSRWSTVTLELHYFDVFWTCRTSCSYTVLQQSARIRLTRRVARSVCDSRAFVQHRYMTHRHRQTDGGHIYRAGIARAVNKKLSYRRGTARCVVSIEILPITTQQCRNYLYDKS